MSPTVTVGPSIDQFVEDYHKMFPDYPNGFQGYGIIGSDSPTISPLPDTELARIYAHEDTTGLSGDELKSFLDLENAYACKEVLADYALNSDNVRRLRPGDEVVFFLNGFGTALRRPYTTVVTEIGFSQDKESRLISPAIANEWIQYKTNPVAPQPYVFIAAENEQLLAQLPTRSTTIPKDYKSGPINF